MSVKAKFVDPTKVDNYHTYSTVICGVCDNPTEAVERPYFVCHTCYLIWSKSAKYDEYEIDVDKSLGFQQDLIADEKSDLDHELRQAYGVGLGDPCVYWTDDIYPDYRIGVISEDTFRNGYGVPVIMVKPTTAENEQTLMEPVYSVCPLDRAGELLSQ